MIRAQVEELRKLGRAADREDRSVADSLQALIKHPSWGVYEKLLQSQVQAKADEVMEPANGVDRMVGLEYVKGAMSGLLTAIGLPGMIIAAMKTPPSDASDGGDDE